MHDAFQSWLERAATSPAVLACGVRFTDDSAVVKSSQADISEARVLEVLRGLSDTVRLLKQNQIGADRFCWTLQMGQIYCATRPDEVMGVVLAGFDPGAIQELDQLLNEFLCAEVVTP